MQTLSQQPDTHVPIPRCSHCESPMRLLSMAWDNQTAEMKFSCRDCARQHHHQRNNESSEPGLQG